ncbi:MAG: alpha/beta fold hydrolase [Nitriliruptorales bacterium]|nr:alpha/beta fold hydrolase [Nitriliruptorales bacterium]
MRRSSLLLILLLAAGGLLAANRPPVSCHDGADNARPLPLRNEHGERLSGVYAAPTADPSALVVMMHGYGHTSESWIPHVERVAAQDGALAVAIDYRGDIRTKDPQGLDSSRGWNVTAGAEDAIDVAHAFLAACPTIEDVVAYGISMGGNSSGLAIAAGATRADGETPLFDIWFNVEGATNVVETYLGARALAPTNEFAANAQADIEAEMGGPIEATGPEPYLERSILYRAEDVAASGVAGIVMVHGVDDGLVPYNQSREFAQRMRQLGIPVELHTVTTKGDAESGTTATGYVLGALGQDFVTAGHASEASTTHVVNRIAFERLSEILAGADVSCHETVYDGAEPQGTAGC